MERVNITVVANRLKKEIVGCRELLPLKKSIKKLTGSRKSWPPLVIGDLVVPTPIIQGGMGVGISLSSLASAVTNAGGIGVIAANGIGLLEKGYFQNGEEANIRALRKEIQRARTLTDGPIGVNIMVAISDFTKLLSVCIEEKVELLFLGAGLPIKGIDVPAIRKANIKVVPIVSGERAAAMIWRMWEKLYNDTPDAVVVEGPKAGGHLGFSAEQIEDPSHQLEAIIPRVKAALSPFEVSQNKHIPIIAAGGVHTGGDIHRLLALGASAVQMGSRFVATDECDADLRFKEAFIAAKKEDIGLIDSPVGMVGRAIRNKFIHDSEAGQRPAFRCAYPCLATCKAQEAHYCISIALNNARKGNLASGFVFAGANAHRIKRIVPVASLIGELQSGYERALATTLNRLLDRFTALKGELVAAQSALAELAQSYETAFLALLPAKDRLIERQYRRAAALAERIRLKMSETALQAALLLS